MSKEFFILTLVGTAIIGTLLSSTTALSLFGGVLSLPSPVANVWALNITGTAGPDTLTGTPDKDVIKGLGGNDMISGREGGDVLSGGPGDDTIHGDAGRDRITGGAGNDKLFGDGGPDMLNGGAGDDTLTGGPGKDRFNCGAGVDTVTDFNPAEDNNTLIGCENARPVSTTTSTPSTGTNTPSPATGGAADITKNPFNIPTSLPRTRDDSNAADQADNVDEP
jgi:Ca2+-binding RTX toxin-like protein